MATGRRLRKRPPRRARAELLEKRGEAAAEDQDRYLAENIFWVPQGDVLGRVYEYLLSQFDAMGLMAQIGAIPVLA